MSIRDFILGFIIGSLATALACLYIFLKAYKEQLDQIKDGLKEHHQ